MNKDELVKREKVLLEKEKQLRNSLAKKQQAAFAKFPLVFTLLGAFGLVATLYGFERLIDEVAFLSDNPVVLLVTGLVILVFTGSLYKRLQ